MITQFLHAFYYNTTKMAHCENIFESAIVLKSLNIDSSNLQLYMNEMKTHSLS